MYLLDSPSYKIEDFFDELLNGRHNNKKNNFLKTRLLAIKSPLIDTQNDYQRLGRDKLLHSLSVQETINIPTAIKLKEGIPRTISVSEMEKVYNNYLVDDPESDKIGRKVYNSILANTYHNLCPYCSHREVKTVDHYFPKSKFASYAITPINLLPCCSDCNKDKLDDYNLQEEKMFIHPYFDDLRNHDWLECIVVRETWPITFSYSVSSDIGDVILKSRIRFQFKKLNLSKLYSDNAAREFNKRVKSLINEYNSNPSNQGLDFLNENIDSYNYENKNSWQSKMFEALRNSEWFITTALPELENYYIRDKLHKLVNK
jgi:5-methylcytosine-specific restriction endonuclease McrA